MSTARPGFLSQPVVKNVMVYRNGDPFYGGRKLVVNEKRVSSFETFLKEVTGGVQAPFGAVRNLYTPRQGHRVNRLEDLQSGEHYVAAGAERFKKLDYSQIGLKKKTPILNNAEIKPVAHSRIIASARFKRPIQEPCTIFLIGNGDVLNPAVRLLIPRRLLAQWEKVLEMITEKMNNRTGAIRRLYTLDGRLLCDGAELENGQFYVAVGRDKFKKLPYSDLIFSKPASRRYNGSKAASLPPIPGSRKYKEGVSDRQIKSGGESTDVGDTVISPQLLKRRVKKEPSSVGEDAAFDGKLVKGEPNKNNDSSLDILDNDEGVFKAYETRSETRGAVEVQEDEETQVELPVDQRPAETVEEEPREEFPEEEDISEEEENLYLETSPINGQNFQDKERVEFLAEEVPDDSLLASGIKETYESFSEPTEEEEEVLYHEEEEREEENAPQHIDEWASVETEHIHQEEEDLAETKSLHAVEESEDQFSLERTTTMTPTEEITNSLENKREE